MGRKKTQASSYYFSILCKAILRLHIPELTLAEASNCIRKCLEGGATNKCNLMQLRERKVPERKVPDHLVSHRLSFQMWTCRDNFYADLAKSYVIHEFGNFKTCVLGEYESNILEQRNSSMHE